MWHLLSTCHVRRIIYRHTYRWVRASHKRKPSASALKTVKDSGQPLMEERIWRPYGFLLFFGWRMVVTKLSAFVHGIWPHLYLQKPTTECFPLSPPHKTCQVHVSASRSETYCCATTATTETSALVTVVWREDFFSFIPQVETLFFAVPEKGASTSCKWLENVKSSK